MATRSTTGYTNYRYSSYAQTGVAILKINSKLDPVAVNENNNDRNNNSNRNHVSKAVLNIPKRGFRDRGTWNSTQFSDAGNRSGPNFIRKPFCNLNEEKPGYRSRGAVQDFETLRDRCFNNGTLFEDPEFPAEDSSLYFSRRPDRYIEWRRPMEIADDPQFFVEGFSRFDVQQGELGDCWLLAAVVNLTMNPRLFFRVVPEDQSFDEKYAGIFHFSFWQYGKWVDVVIDDRLPTHNGQLLYLHSAESNEFWSALLEKAYAKLHGSYEALKGGITSEAMVDFTGGVSETYHMNETPPNLFKIMLQAFERNALLGCSIEPDPDVLEATTPEGLVRGHAYSITQVKCAETQSFQQFGKLCLLRLRNPWGNEAEWNGPWSDQSYEWRLLQPHEKEELGLKFDNDGEFWMSFHDFKKYFTQLDICNLDPNTLGMDEKKWNMDVFEGKWVRGVTAGGCRNYLETFWHNPQYRITLETVDSGNESCSVIVALMQKNRRSLRRTGADCLTIGFAVYLVQHPDSMPRPLDLNFFKYNASAARSTFINLREVTCHFTLPPGTYCIVPSTFDPNEEGEFLLRVFTEKDSNLENYDEEPGIGEIDQSVREEPEPEENTDRIQEFFKKLAGDDMEVDWMELKEILDFAMRNETNNRGFSSDVCRSIVAMMDVDQSGKLGFKEFKTLWNDVRMWRAVFKLHNKDEPNYLSGFELRQAMNSAGFRVNNSILNLLMLRYGTNDGSMTFDDYIMCMVRLKTMLGIFREQEENGVARFTMEEFMEKTLYS